MMRLATLTAIAQIYVEGVRFQFVGAYHPCSPIHLCRRYNYTTRWTSIQQIWSQQMHFWHLLI